jgi:DNA (cytosine-5)-methyltransferase 1
VNLSASKEISIRSIRQQFGLGMIEFSDMLGISIDLLKKYERSLVLPDAKLIFDLETKFELQKQNLLSTHENLIDNKTIGEGYVTSIPQRQIKIERKSQLQNTFPILDLFCGIGGFSHGFERTKSFEVVAGVDLLGDRINTFQNNHTHADTYCWDIYDLNPLNILKTSPKPKVIIGGPPCQGFSSIRPYRSFIANDRRNNLFEQYAYFVSVLKPEWFVLENVVGLLTHNKGETFKTLISTFEAIGYVVSFKVLNAASYGLPQSRERVIIVGNNKKIKFEFPNATHHYEYQSMVKKGSQTTQKNANKPEIPPALTIMDAIHDLPEIPSGGKAFRYKQEITLTPFEQSMRGNCKELTLHEATLHSDRMLEIIRNSGDNISAVSELVRSGFSSSYSRLSPHKPATTLTVNFVHPSSNKCIHPYQDRALTPREGARLQSFRDDYKFFGTKTQIIKQIGNAVPPLLGTVIANQILKYL